MLPMTAPPQKSKEIYNDKFEDSKIPGDILQKEINEDYKKPEIDSDIEELNKSTLRRIKSDSSQEVYVDDPLEIPEFTTTPENEDDEDDEDDEIWIDDDFEVPEHIKIPEYRTPKIDDSESPKNDDFGSPKIDDNFLKNPITSSTTSLPQMLKYGLGKEILRSCNNCTFFGMVPSKTYKCPICKNETLREI